MSGKFIGNANLTKDVELRQAGENSVADLSVAVNNGYGDRQKTAFLDVTVWGKQAEACAKYLAKGDAVYLEAFPQTESWETDGQKRYKLKFTATLVDFLSTKPKSNTSSDNSSDIEQVATNDEIPF